MAAARLAPIDTAHNTALAVVVEGGLIALALATGIVVVSVRSIFATGGALRIALATLMMVWLMSSLVGTVGESRTTWLLLAVCALSQRLTVETPEQVERQFPSAASTAKMRVAERLP